MSQSHHATADNKDMTSKDHILESNHNLLYHFFQGEIASRNVDDIGSELNKRQIEVNLKELVSRSKYLLHYNHSYNRDADIR